MFDNIPCEKCHSNQTDTKRSVYEKIIRVTQFDIICLPNSKLMQFVRASNNDPMLPTSSKTLPSLPFNYSRNTFRLPEPFKKLELIPSRPLSFVQEFTHSKQPINYKDDIIFELMQKNNWMAAELLALRKPISQSPLITIHPSTAAINKKQMSKNSSLSLSEDASWSSTQLEVFYTSDWVETLRTFKKEYDQSHSLQMSYVHQLGVLQNKIEVLQAELDSKNAFTFKLLNRTVGAESVTLEQLKTTEDYLKASKQDFQSALKKIQQLEAEVVVNMKLTITSNAEANVLKSKLLLMNEQYDFKEIQFADIHQANLTFKERIDSKNLTMESQVKEAREQEKRIKLLET